MTDPVIIGSVALDTIETPSGTFENILGGSAVFASLAASYFTTPGIVGVAGTDFPQEHISSLREKNIDLEGLKTEGKTFRWEGKYEGKMDRAETKKVELNSFETFDPVLPQKYRKARYVLLGNINPELQIKVLEQVEDPVLVALDSMDIWINSKRDQLTNAIKKTNILLMNEEETRLFFKKKDLAKAGEEALEMGIDYFIVKKGENGALMFSRKGMFSAPAYPVKKLKDPTGCGDCFAGSLMGYLAKKNRANEENIRRAVIYGNSTASVNAESHGPDRLMKTKMEEIDERYSEIKKNSSL